ncbi:hypothetical protein [Kocuria sp.]|uniref:hypothetical protein n=1 Tax=Kocuria sp. TaxID=1871328 RepID=UPI0026DC26EA|nr:hypothetical protein [Kocuria sp.]MDO4920069.1 hypothetical protein [Kocuria sp.]
MNPDIISGTTTAGTTLTTIEDGEDTKVLMTGLDGRGHVLGTVVFDGQATLISMQDHGCLLSADVLRLAATMLDGRCATALLDLDELTEGAQDPEPPAPVVTPEMVQLVLDTYAEHEDVVTRDRIRYCAECDAPLVGWLTPAAHARNMAAAVLEDALAKAGSAPSGLPASVVAVLDAWRVPGPQTVLHGAAKNQVWKAFPFLAARLDQACTEHPGGDDA